MGDPTGDVNDERAGTVPPIGWYPDPGGAPAWRRWEGTSWGEATMPYGPTEPDPTSLVRERATWQLLRVTAPWALAAQALGVLMLASESPTLGALRHWVRAYWEAKAHGRPLPPAPTAGIIPTSAAATLTHYALLVLTVLALVAWLRFLSASMRVATAARYPQHHHFLWTLLLFFIPVVGPVVAWGASSESLPSGHEARTPLGVGWMLVAAGELAWLGLYATVLTTPSAVAAWAVAAVGAIAWVAAAVVLPLGFQAIAEDHASLGVRLSPSYS